MRCGWWVREVGSGLGENMVFSLGLIISLIIVGVHWALWRKYRMLVEINKCEEWAQLGKKITFQGFRLNPAPRHKNANDTKQLRL